MKGECDVILKRMPHNVRIFHAVVVYCYTLEKLLPLLRKKNDHPIYPGLWGFPAGRVEPGEDIFQAAIRELREETGNVKDREHIKRLGLCYPTLHHAHNSEKTLYFWAHMMFCTQPLIITPRISSEHASLSLVTIHDILADKFNLIPDAFDNFRDSLKIINGISAK